MFFGDVLWVQVHYDMCVSIASTRVSIPHFLFPPMLWYIKRQIQSLAHFDIYSVSPLESAKTGNVPALFGHSSNDDLVPFEQGKAVFDAYACPDKKQFVFTGKHNGVRSDDWIKEGVTFSLRVLGLSIENITISDSRRLQRNELHFGSFDEMMAEINARKQANNQK